jgi:DNA excision repair protein ERCC-3
MSYFPENALIVHSDRSILLEVHSPKPPRKINEAIVAIVEAVG